MKASILTLSWVLALVTAEKACHTGCMKLAAPGTSTIDYDYGAPSSTLTQPGGPIITARRTGDQLTQVVTPLSTGTMEFDVTYTALPRSVAHECDSGNCVTIGLPGGVFKRGVLATEPAPTLANFTTSSLSSNNSSSRQTVVLVPTSTVFTSTFTGVSAAPTQTADGQTNSIPSQDTTTYSSTIVITSFFTVSSTLTSWIGSKSSSLGSPVSALPSIGDSGSLATASKPASTPAATQSTTTDVVTSIYTKPPPAYSASPIIGHEITTTATVPLSCSAQSVVTVTSTVTAPPAGGIITVTSYLPPSSTTTYTPPVKTSTTTITVSSVTPSATGTQVFVTSKPASSSLTSTAQAGLTSSSATHGPYTYTTFSYNTTSIPILAGTGISNLSTTAAYPITTGTLIPSPAPSPFTGGASVVAMGGEAVFALMVALLGAAVLV